MFNQSQLVQVIQEDEFQKERITELVLRRNNNEFDEGLFSVYLNEGIFWSDNIEMFIDIMGRMGISVKDLGYEDIIIKGLERTLELGYEPGTLLTRGYLVPIYNHLGEFLFFINYNGDRDKNQKYFIVYPTATKEFLAGIRVLGLNDIKQSLSEGRLVVTEGTFDRLRLKAQGIPAVATMGTQLTDYFKDLAKRFKVVYYIGDNDDAGNKSYKSGRYAGLRMLKVEVPKGKDIDEFGAMYPEEFREFVQRKIV